MGRGEDRRTAVSSQLSGDIRRAELVYRRLIEESPEAGDVTNLGALLRGAGRAIEAIHLYKEYIPRVSRSIELLMNAVNAALETEMFALGKEWISIAEDEYGMTKQVEHARARLDIARGMFKEAEDRMKRLRGKWSDDSEIMIDYALCIHRQGRLREALEVYLEGNVNGDARLANNILTIYAELGEWPDAEKLIRGLDNKIRKNGDVRGTIARMYMQRYDFDKAIRDYSVLCCEYPLQPLHWLNLSACLRGIKHNVAAHRTAKRGLVLNPTFEPLRHALLQCMAEIGKNSQAVKIIREISRERIVSDSQIHNSFQFIGSGYGLVEKQELSEVAKMWESSVIREGVREIQGDRVHSCWKNRKIRIAYLSADFCNHPVGRFMAPVLASHNRDKFEVIGISAGKVEDSVQYKLRGLCDKWLDVQYMNPLEIARCISDLKTDIVIELGGYTGGSQLAALCFRPAPVQLSYLGYFAPTYLRSIDGWIGDEVLFGGLSPVERNAHKLYMVTGGYMCYEEDIEVEIKPTQGRSFRFGSMNHSRKLSKETVEIFVEVMKEARNAELYLKSVSFIEDSERERIRESFREMGIDDDRLIIVPWVEGRNAHLNAYSEIDVALDARPYGGATTSCEALYMGVPVITYCGNGMAGRLTASINSSAGLSEYNAKSNEEFKKIALRFYGDGIRNEEQTELLRSKVKRSGLMDRKRIGSELERVYIGAMRSVQ